MDIRKKRGLSKQEAFNRLHKYGLNVLPEKPPPSSLSIFLAQLKSPLVYILLVAAVATFVLREYSDAIIISFAVFINTVLGFIQEQKANNALQALKQMIHPKARVVREGKEIDIDISQVVPGDVVVLNQGDKVPADGEILEAHRLFIAEAILTGESVPVTKEAGGKGFMGTIVTAGRGYMEVGMTGAKTEMGKIALRVQEEQEDTPLRRQLAYFSKQLTILTLVLIAIVFVVGVFQKRPLLDIFTTSVALSVSAIPEGLLVALTVVLAIGTQRILKRKGLIRNLVSAETLGGVTTICADKTGTLTEGKMLVVETVGDTKELMTQAILANDHDDPIVIAMGDWAQLRQGSAGQASKLLEKYPRLDSIPFSSEERYFAALHKMDSGNKIFVNGAPDIILEWCGLSLVEKEKIKTEITELTKKGMRLLGMASKSMPETYKELKDGDVKKGLSWVGILAFTDPPRAGVAEALKRTAKAGVRTIVITGDYPETARVVMNSLELKIESEHIILGEDLKAMEGTDLKKVLKQRTTLLFARTTPEQKLKIVDALKANGEVVAMTGDGVNDAPALAKSDIGIVVGSASEVAKESADLVLLDSSFATIVATIEEGRGIFENIRKIILYLMSDAFAEIVAVVGAMLLGLFLSGGLPLPITTAQILWINLVSDGFPHLALTVDPKRKGIMDEPPRKAGERLVANWMKVLIAAVSITSGVSALVLFLYILNTGGGVVEARSVVFATLASNSLVYVFSVRALTDPLWKTNILDNKWLLLAVFGGVLLTLAPFTFDVLIEFFEIQRLSLADWGMVGLASFVMLVMIEIFKVVFRRRLVKLAA